MSSYRTRWWEPLTLASVVAAGLGLLLGAEVLLAAALVPLALLVYGRLVVATPDDVRITRALEPTDPRPGEHVDVTVTVHNEGDRPLNDVRVVDDLPETLGVVDGHPSQGLVVPPGGERSFTYTVVARRGQHPFGEPAVVSYSFSASQATVVEPAVETTLECSLPVEEVPLSGQAAPDVGRIQTDSGGSGIEFHSTREYRSTDSMTRVDWRRFARSGELTTIDYREDRSATVVVLVDTRDQEAYQAAAGEPTARELNTYAGERAFEAILEQGNRADVSLFDGRPTALAPGAGTGQVERGRSTFAETNQTRVADGGVAADDDEPGSELLDSSSEVEQLLGWLPTNAQVVLVSSLSDDRMLRVGRTLSAHRHDVHVLCPAVVGEATTGQRLERRARDLRIDRLRAAGFTVVEWEPRTPLTTTLDRVLTGLVR